MKEVCKVYKPEILTCPICNSKLVYCYTVSNKNVYFLNGKNIRIKNLGYKCSSCDDETTHVSQSASRYCFKGYSYTVKVVSAIAILKEQGKSRDYICDYLYNKGVEISDRNVGNLYLKFNELMNLDYVKVINEAYDNMMNKYNQIRLTINMVKVLDENVVFVFDSFTSEVLAIKRFKENKEDAMQEFFSTFLNKDLNISHIFTIRRDQLLHPVLRGLCPKNTKFIPFVKL